MAVSSSTPTPSTCRNDSEAWAYETTHVHNVYDEIAAHFSETRYKPWPVVDSFLRSLRPGAIGLDIGCGNGKYLAVRSDIYVLASDYSTELVKIASRHEPHSALVADSLELPHPPGVFDFAISIAVIHHFSTSERRIEAVRHVLERLRPLKGTMQKMDGGAKNLDKDGSEGRERMDIDMDISGDRNEQFEAGEALFFVWALEQKNSRRGWDEGHEQDVLVPWLLKSSPQQQSSACDTGCTSTITETDSGSDAGTHETAGLSPMTFHRYYHLYRRGELEKDILAAGGHVVRSGYDRDNWWCVARRQSSLS